MHPQDVGVWGFCRAAYWLDKANTLWSLTRGLDDRDSVALRLIFEYGRQHDFILSRGTETSQDVSVITSTQNHL